MARYSRRRGPASDHEIADGFNVVSGLSVERFFDAGELLVFVSAQYHNGTGNVQSPDFDVFVDGVALHPIPFEHDIASGDAIPLGGTWLVPVDRGVHTIDFRVDGDSVTGDIMRQDGSELVVVQLPLWDSDEDIS